MPIKPNTQNNKHINIADLESLSLKIDNKSQSIQDLSQPEIVDLILDLEKDWAYILDIAIQNPDPVLKAKAEEVKPKLQQLHYDLHQKLEVATAEDLNQARTKLSKLFFKLKATNFKNVNEANSEQKEIIQQIYQVLDYDIEKGVRNFEQTEVRQMAYKLERKAYNQIFN